MMPSMSHPGRAAVRLAGAFLLLAAGLLPAGAEEAAGGPKLPAVTVVKATSGEVSEQIVASGSLVPREEVLVAPQIDGLAVSEILVEEGDRVKKGQTLARLSNATLQVQMAQSKAQIARAQAAIAQAKAQVAQAEAALRDRQRALKRAQTLGKQGFATAEKMDQMVSDVDVGEAQVEAAHQSVAVTLAELKALEAQRDELQWRLDHTDITAPQEGIVSRRKVRIGQIGAMAGEPMFRIIGSGEIELEADVADLSLPRLTKGLLAEVLPAGFSDPIAGRVRLVSPEIDPTTRLGRVRITVQSDPRLVIGASARGVVVIGRRSGVTVPLSAITYDRQGPQVLVVTDGVVDARRVRLGLIGVDRAEVAEGLSSGEMIVARAGTFLRDGDHVRPIQTVIEQATQ